MPKIMRCSKRNINWEVYSDKCLQLKGEEKLSNEKPDYTLKTGKRTKLAEGRKP